MDNPTAGRADSFLDQFSAFEGALRTLVDDPGETPFATLVHRAAECYGRLRPHEGDLVVIGDIRNLLVHRRGGATQFMEVLPRASAVLEQVAAVVASAPARALDVAVRASDIFTTVMDALALPVMKAMRDRVFTHVPVLETGRVAGVFSETAVFNAVAAGDFQVGEETRIGDFRPHLALAASAGNRYAFAARGATYVEIRKLFGESFERRERVGAVFITEHGARDEGLLGMLTAWDVAGV